MKKIKFLLLFILFLFLIGCDNELPKDENIETFEVSFITNCDMEIPVQTVKEGNTLSFIPTLEKEGYVFTSWDKDITAPIYNDTVFTAQWELVQYTITYYCDEETENDNRNSYTINDGFVFSEPKKTGYEFKGWYLDSSFTKKIERIRKGTTENLEIYPCFERITYSITYHLDGGTNNFNNPSSYFASDETIYLLPATKEDYIFIGWYKEESFINLISQITPSEEKSIDLFARFTTNTLANSKVKLDANGGNVEIDKHFDYSSKLYQGQATMYLMYDSQKGYKATLSNELGNLYFYYIALKKTDVQDIYQIKEIVYKSTSVTVKDCDYYLSWHGALQDTTSKNAFEKVYEFRDSFIDGYVELIDIPDSKSSACAIDVLFYPPKAYEGSEFVVYKDPQILPIPTKDGYTFVGWLSNLDGKITSSYPGYYESHKITYTAQWIKNEYVGTNIEKAIMDLSDIMATISTDVEKLDLPKELDNCSISWKSVDQAVLLDNGTIIKPYISKEVTIIAVITNKENGNQKESITFPLQINGEFHDLSKGVKAGYFYATASPSDYSFRNLDIMFIAFGNPTAEGSINNIETLGNNIKKNFLTKAHENGVRVVLSINTANCSTIAASNTLIEKFSQVCADFVKTYGIDGIDMDWEWPSSSEVANFTKLIKAINQKVKALNPNYLITAACGSSVHSRYDLKNSIQYMDYISIMSYDMQLSSTATYHNALYYKKGKTYIAISNSYDNYSALVPASKIIIGVPFYARYWTESTGIGNKATYGGAKSYGSIYTNYILKGYEFWDDDCQVPYVYDETTGFFASYDNPKSIAIKAQYVYDKGMAGLMYWQGGQDYKDMLVTAICNEVTKAFNN